MHGAWHKKRNKKFRMNLLQNAKFKKQNNNKEL